MNAIMHPHEAGLWVAPGFDVTLQDCTTIYSDVDQVLMLSNRPGLMCCARQTLRLKNCRGAVLRGGRPFKVTSYATVVKTRGAPVVQEAGVFEPLGEIKSSMDSLVFFGSPPWFVHPRWTDYTSVHAAYDAAVVTAPYSDLNSNPFAFTSVSPFGGDSVTEMLTERVIANSQVAILAGQDWAGQIAIVQPTYRGPVIFVPDKNAIFGTPLQYRIDYSGSSGLSFSLRVADPGNNPTGLVGSPLNMCNTAVICNLDVQRIASVFTLDFGGTLYFTDQTNTGKVVKQRGDAVYAGTQPPPRIQPYSTQAMTVGDVQNTPTPLSWQWAYDRYLKVIVTTL
jgi:hypothetical protein